MKERYCVMCNCMKEMYQYFVCGETYFFKKEGFFNFLAK